MRRDTLPPTDTENIITGVGRRTCTHLREIRLNHHVMHLSKSRNDSFVKTDDIPNICTYMCECASVCTHIVSYTHDQSDANNEQE